MNRTDAMSSSPKHALLAEYAMIAHALAAPARLMILEQLAQGARGVDGLANKTGLTVANCSQHLQQLRRSGLVVGQRKGKSVIYSLTDPRTLDIMDTLRLLAERNLATVDRILRDLANGKDTPEPMTRDALEARLHDGTVTILDVRPADEFADSHIAGALNVMPDQIDRIRDRLDPAIDIVAYCRGPYCIYAHQAVTALRKQGFNAVRLDGGLPEWRREDRPVAQST